LLIFKKPFKLFKRNEHEKLKKKKKSITNGESSAHDLINDNQMLWAGRDEGTIRNASSLNE